RPRRHPVQRGGRRLSRERVDGGPRRADLPADRVAGGEAVMKHTAIALAMTAFALGAAQGALAQSADMTGRHTMDGTVTRIDEKKGWGHVKTAEGTGIVHVPPASVQGV